MFDGRRKQYRVEEPPLSIAVELPPLPSTERGARTEGAIVEARLDDLSISGARVRVASLVRVAHGTSVRLILGGEPLDAPIWLTATVARRDEVGLEQAYGLRFDDARAVERLLTADVLRLFNRRCAERVAPDPDEPPIVVRLVGADVVEGVLVDLSTTGLGARLPDDAVAPDGDLRVEIALPEHAAPLAVDGRVVSRGDGGRIGLELQPSEEVRAALLAHVTRRQRRRAERADRSPS